MRAGSGEQRDRPDVHAMQHTDPSPEISALSLPFLCVLCVLLFTTPWTEASECASSWTT